MTGEDRLTYFPEKGKSEFNRKDYRNVFKEIATATNGQSGCETRCCGDI